MNFWSNQIHLKTMRKSIYNFLLFTFAAATFTSCSDFLEGSDPSNFPVENSFTLPAHAEASVNAAYANMPDPLSSVVGGSDWRISGFATGPVERDLPQAASTCYVM